MTGHASSIEDGGDSSSLSQFHSLHFSLANPRNDRPSDRPHLLRRIADDIDARGIDPMEILDLTVSQQITEDGPWWSVTLYWSPTGKE